MLGLSHLRGQIGSGELVVVQETGRDFQCLLGELAPMSRQTAGRAPVGQLGAGVGGQGAGKVQPHGARAHGPSKTLALNSIRSSTSKLRLQPRHDDRSGSNILTTTLPYPRRSSRDEHIGPRPLQRSAINRYTNPIHPKLTPSPGRIAVGRIHHGQKAHPLAPSEGSASEESQQTGGQPMCADHVFSAG